MSRSVETWVLTNSVYSDVSQYWSLLLRNRIELKCVRMVIRYFSELSECDIC